MDIYIEAIEAVEEVVRRIILGRPSVPMIVVERGDGLFLFAQVINIVGLPEIIQHRLSARTSATSQSQPLTLND